MPTQFHTKHNFLHKNIEDYLLFISSSLDSISFVKQGNFRGELYDPRCVQDCIPIERLSSTLLENLTD